MGSWKLLSNELLILLYGNTVCDSAVFRMTAYDIYANSAHDPVCE